MSGPGGGIVFSSIAFARTPSTRGSERRVDAADVWSFGLAPRRRVEVCDRRAPASGADREGRCRGAADVATSAFFRATQFVSPAAVSAGRHASARSSPATSAVEGAETESYAG